MKTKKSPTAHAYRYTHDGDAEVLAKHSFPLPPPGPDEVSVEVIAAGINHMEAFLRNGREETWAEDPWPRGSGSDFAGIVIATGAHVSSIRVGADVIGHVRTGAHASHLNVPVTHVVPKPAGVDWETAGGLYLAGATALEVLEDLRIGPDDTVVVTAAAGGVGSIQVQLAARRGARVIGTCGARNFDYLRQIGITPVEYGPGIVERIEKAARGARVTAYIDNFGKDTENVAEALGVPEEKYRSSEDRRDIELALLREDPEAVAHGTERLRQVTQLAGIGGFRLLVSGLYPLEDIIEAYQDLERLHSRGKIVLATHPVTTYRTLRARELHESMP
ncbi:NADP-dependent oxidoreductase [Microbacterium aquimaris]|uniref:NADP-dependent oxidoreductase n=1 Tax=Microbacterium aquimaris TaxID=459816 RepID=A0ABU5N5I1_9MICO|nr:NADP-dependent oxidoreductase [Microbacterium aquimaris]MDZ8161338.1 NADP-dependent oxidoreductase [Microbacterium aquimaris]